MTTDPTETARALFWRHGLPEDIIDGVLCLHAQELAAVQRRDAALWGIDTADGRHVLATADLIDPTKGTPASSAGVAPATDRAALAEDLRYVLNYRGPGHAHERPGVWDTSGKPCGHCARLAAARANLAAYDADPTAVLPETVDRADTTPTFVVWLDAPDGSVLTHDGIQWPDGWVTIRHRHYGHTTTHHTPEAAARAAHGKQGRIVWPDGGPRRVAAEARTTEPLPTPCDQPNACDPDTGELCATHEEEQAHAEGEHEYCGITCEIQMPSAPMYNSIVAHGIPGTGGMLDELLRRAAAGPLPTAEERVPEPDVVAFRSPDKPSALWCREHGLRWWGLTPLTSEDLPDGGVCGQCGVDVLIPQQPKEA